MFKVKPDIDIDGDMADDDEDIILRLILCFRGAFDPIILLLLFEVVEMRGCFGVDVAITRCCDIECHSLFDNDDVEDLQIINYIK